LTPAEASKLICEELGPGDLQAPYNQPPPGAHRLWGHCAIASEALFYSTGGKGPTSQLGPDAGGPHGWAVWRVRHEGSTHWFLKDKAGKIWDLTAQQFKTPVPYHLATKTFFVTKTKGQGASKRTVDVLRRIKEKRMSNPTERPLSFDELHSHSTALRRVYFAAFAKLARAPGGFLNIATAKLTPGERRRLANLATTGRWVRWADDRRSSGVVEMRAAGWSLWNYAVNGAMETRNAEELRLALEEERQPNPVSTHPYALHGRVESGDVVREEPLDGYGLARAERDFRARPDGVAYTVRGTHGGPRSYANAGGVWESVPFGGGPRQDWERSLPPKPVYAPYSAPGEEARLDAMSAREEARMGRLMRGRKL